ncbi:MAG: hypothetical protein AAF414_22750, partial [Pseudomonadota bacterium]
MADPEIKWDLIWNLPKQASGSSETSGEETPSDDSASEGTSAEETSDTTASEDAGQAGDEGAHAEGGGESHTLIEAVEAVEGAPPEDHHAEGFFQDTYTYTGLSLLLLIIIAARPAWRAIAGMLDGRADRIRNELDEAQKLREEAQAALANFQRKQRDAMAEAEGIMQHAREESERIRQRSLEALEES